MAKSPLTIGVISYRKASDAALCKVLEDNFENILIVQYQIPFTEWIKWPLRRIRLMGLFVLAGHLLLAAYIRAERLWEKIHCQSLWKSMGINPPQWNQVKTKKVFCFNETQLADKLKQTDVIVALDSFRLTHRFFRKLKKPVLQIIWGDLPEYGGDSGGFWAYALGEKNKVGVSLVSRGSQINQMKIIKKISITSTDKENLRSIKVKQVVALLPQLSLGIIDFMNDPELFKRQNMEVIRYFQAPTMWTYIKFLKNKKLRVIPKYACHITNNNPN